MQVAPFDLRRAAADSFPAAIATRPGVVTESRAGRGKAVDRPLRISDLSRARLPSFAKGGTVPGARGEPRVILAHGGEQVQPVVPPIHLGGATHGGRTVTVNMPLHMDNARFGGDVTMADLERWHDRAVDKAQEEVLEALSGG